MSDNRACNKESQGKDPQHFSQLLCIEIHGQGGELRSLPKHQSYSIAGTIVLPLILN